MSAPLLLDIATELAIDRLEELTIEALSRAVHKTQPGTPERLVAELAFAWASTEGTAAAAARLRDLSSAWGGPKALPLGGLSAEELTALAEMAQAAEAAELRNGRRLAGTLAVTLGQMGRVLGMAFLKAATP